MQQVFPIHRDVFSNGQIDSKLWLCRELEALNFNKEQRIWILGGWYGVAAFLLLSREQLPIEHIRSFDIDPDCELVANMLNENWNMKNWKFKALTQDANLIEYYYNEPDIIINTSCEHFNSMDWFNRIPSGKLVALQSNNLHHDSETFQIDNLNEMILKYPLTDIIYSGSMYFSYIDKSYTRFMMIGLK